MGAKAILLAVVIALLPLSAAAKVNDLTIRVAPQKQVDKFCDALPKETVYGCFEGGGKNKIYITRGLTGEEFAFVFWHEMGHYYLETVELKNYYRGGTIEEQEELAADRFSQFMTGDKGDLTGSELKLFEDALKGRYLYR